MKKILKGAIAGVALLLAPFTQASMVTDWNFSVTLEWEGFVFGPGSGLGTNNPLNPNYAWQTSERLVWGDPTNYSGDAIGTSRSALIISNSPANGTISTNGPFALTNIITHYNNPISASYATLTSAVLKSTLLLTPLNPADSALDLLVANFNINFIETPNEADCPFPSVSECDDIFVISNEALNTSFIYNGFKYFISIVEANGALNPMDVNTCGQAGIVGPCLGFKTQENQSTEAQFAFLITTEPVTIVAAPGVLALMGLGLVALVGVRRRKQLVA
ncbi:MAG: THxN family PEP-CTERM protein [Alishewanella agri]|nr:THxN family PEP-CTERM protein [Alishewanella agri]